MKMRNFDYLNLKDAFAPMPDGCHDALMDAARSVKEEKEMKRASFRVALIATSILVVTMVAALAATQLGLIDFFNNHFNIPLPDSAQTVLNSTEQKTYTVGPLAITLRETLADGRIAYLTTQAKTYDGSKALIQMSNGDTSDRIPNSEAARLKVPEKTTFLDATKQANVPLYFVSSYLTIDESYMGGEGMQDILWDADGSAMLVNMQMTNPGTVLETLKGTLTLRVREIDPATSSYAEGKDWKIEEEISIPVNGVTAEKTYAPEGEAQLAGFTVQSVKAEKTCAGVYLTATMTAGTDAVKEDAWKLYDMVEFRDSQGKAFPDGISLSGILNDEGWPTVILERMISAEALPDTMQVANSEDGSSVTLK
jgi:hypothetical protein